MSKKVIITGCAGFVGTNLCLYLLDKGYEILGFDIGDRHERLRESNILLHPAFTLQTLNLAVQGPIVTKDIVAIFHLAALPHVDYSYFYPHQTITNNIASLLRIIEVAIRFNVPLIFSSSVEVYGGRIDKSYGEDDVLLPLSPYAASKVANEAMIASYIETQGLKATIFRLTNLYGPWQAPDRLLPRIISQILLGVPSTIEKGTKRDCVFVEEACEMLERAIHFDHSGNTFNLCTGKRIDNFDVVQLVSVILPSPKLQTVPPKKRDGRGRFLIATPHKLHRATRWRAQH